MPHVPGPGRVEGLLPPAPAEPERLVPEEVAGGAGEDRPVRVRAHVVGGLAPEVVLVVRLDEEGRPRRLSLPVGEDPPGHRPVGVGAVDVEPALVAEVVEGRRPVRPVGGVQVLVVHLPDRLGERPHLVAHVPGVAVAAVDPEEVRERAVALADPEAVLAATGRAGLLEEIDVAVLVGAEVGRRHEQQEPALLGLLEHAVDVRPVGLVGLRDVVADEGLLAVAVGGVRLAPVGVVGVGHRHHQGVEALRPAGGEVADGFLEREVVGERPRRVAVDQEGHAPLVHEVAARGPDPEREGRVLGGEQSRGRRRARASASGDPGEAAHQGRPPTGRAYARGGRRDKSGMLRPRWARRASISSTCSRTCATPTRTRSRRRSSRRSWRTPSTRVRRASTSSPIPPRRRSWWWTTAAA